jgi:hypothetical protein
LPVSNLQLLNARVSGTNFLSDYNTLAGHHYFVEYKNALSDVSWQSQPSVTGDGTTKTFTIPRNAFDTRFVRVRAQ